MWLELDGFVTSVEGEMERLLFRAELAYGRRCRNVWQMCVCVGRGMKGNTFLVWWQSRILKITLSSSVGCWFGQQQIGGLIMLMVN